MLNRRENLGAMAAAGVALAAGPSDRLNVAVVGIRGRGRSLIQSFARSPRCRITHLCDVNTEYFGPIGKLAADAMGNGAAAPECVQDIRKLLEIKSVDAIVVATPDHWHALATIWGCQAGKHVYVEKPVSHNIGEGRRMVEASRRHNRVVQTGTQSRSVPHMIEAIDYVRSGKIGKVHMARAFNSQLRRRVNAVADAKPPATLDWEIWQGPAPERPFNGNRYSYGWRWYWEYGTGDMGNDGVHDLDIARWGLGVESPSLVTGFGTKTLFKGDTQETPDTQTVSFHFPEADKVLLYDQKLWAPYHMEGYENGVVFYGTDGYLVLGRSGWKVVERGNKLAFDKKAAFSDQPHVENFLAACRGEAKPNCDILEGHRSTTLAHLGNLACRLGRPIKFEAATETVAGDAEAGALLSRKGRGAFLIPDKA
ncbi:MAG: Gfo/Idh/MocA family protein [Planctomycetota bacterium]